MTRGAGRFAPSPTGPLHHGSLLAATASFLDARANGLDWQLRIDDIDTPRVAPGAEDAIRTALEAHGLVWDGPVVRQSERTEHYQAALDVLRDQGLLFYCTCSRRQLSGREVYPGTCRHRQQAIRNAAVRVRVEHAPVRFHDLIHGDRAEVLTDTCGDFVVRRRDGIIAYQLATAVDDGDPGIVRVIRGGDLLDITARQIYLMRCLGCAEPVYAHLPTLVDEAGQKLSKQTHAPALDNHRPTANLLAVFPSLALHPPEDAGSWTPDTLLQWALARFDLGTIQGGPVVFRAFW